MADAQEQGTTAARFALAAYRAFGHAVTPFLGFWLRGRARRGKEVRARIPERYGCASASRPEGPLVWLHAASVGELNSVLPLAHRLRGLGLGALVTTGTTTSAQVAADKLPDGAIHQFQPIDAAPNVTRFLDHWRPDLAIFVESEIWPVTLEELARRNVQQLLVNARMSDRSFARWSKRPGLARALFSHLGQVVAQSEIDAERYRALGAPRVTVRGNLKFDATPLAADEAVLDELREAFGKRPVWTAASLHPSEATAVAQAAATVVECRSDTLLVAVPRHPERADTLREAFEAQGLKVAQRSRNQTVGTETQVLLADTMGEMGVWFRLASIAFMGKSLVAGSETGGGQNPIEPVLCGAAVLSGRAVQNFREPYRQLLLDGGARLVDDADMLADFVTRLWARDDALADMRIGGAKTVERMAGAVSETMSALEPWLAPLRMRAMLDSTREVQQGHMAGLSAARLRAIREAEIGGRKPGTLPGGLTPPSGQASAGE